MNLRFGKIAENALFVLVACVTIVVTVQAFRFEQKMANQKLLYYQLQTLRTSVNLFKAINKKNPETLTELASAEYAFPGEDHSHNYLDSNILTENGVIFDPFGNPYHFDAKSGWVRCTSRGYELW